MNPVTAVSPEVRCPVCPTIFRIPAGFVRHMVVDHWCESDLAADCWREGLLAAPR